jgi:hypothetical protein
LLDIDDADAPYLESKAAVLDQFDPRVLDAMALEFIRACQSHSDCFANTATVWRGGSKR